MLSSNKVTFYNTITSYKHNYVFKQIVNNSVFIVVL